MSTPVNKGEGGGQNTQNPVNVVYEQSLRQFDIKSIFYKKMYKNLVKAKICTNLPPVSALKQGGILTPSLPLVDRC